MANCQLLTDTHCSVLPLQSHLYLISILQSPRSSINVQKDHFIILTDFLQHNTNNKFTIPRGLDLTALFALVSDLLLAPP